MIAKPNQRKCPRSCVTAITICKQKMFFLIQTPPTTMKTQVSSYICLFFSRFCLLLAPSSALQPSFCRWHHLLCPAWLWRLTSDLWARGNKGRTARKVLCVCLHLCEWIFSLTKMSYLWSWEVKRKEDEGECVWMSNELRVCDFIPQDLKMNFRLMKISCLSGHAGKAPTSLFSPFYSNLCFSFIIILTYCVWRFYLCVDTGILLDLSNLTWVLLH